MCGCSKYAIDVGADILPVACSILPGTAACNAVVAVQTIVEVTLLAKLISAD